jgi:5-oxopent-3-ene-1,2,5-tricarboxylate decarboxylase/2-hydroxyhepta-2,4-diene-1,7-dioate isomerase
VGSPNLATHLNHASQVTNQKQETNVYLARIRRTVEAEPELVARIPARETTSGGDLLLPLADALGRQHTDPVAVAVSADLSEAARRAVAAADESLALRAADVIFDVPTPTCTKVCCLALNYRDHAAESNLEVPPDPVLFFKPASSLVGHGAMVRAPARTSHLEHEVELGVVIGRETKDLPASRWREAVAGYTIINDMTARDLQLVSMQRNVPWDQSKSFDTFAPVGPYLVTLDEVDDPHALQMTLSVGGELRQEANTSQMVFAIPQLIEDLSNGMTLVPGDIIATGTTAGIAPLKSGDVMTCTITGLGSLVNEVIYEMPPA